MPLLAEFSSGGSSGTFTEYTTSVAVTPGDIVALNTSSLLVLADATFMFDSWRVIGVVLVGATVGNKAIVVTGFGATTEVKFVTAPSVSTNGTYCFLSTVPGKAVLIPPMGAGRVRFLIGTLGSADGITMSPGVLFQPEYLSRSP